MADEIVVRLRNRQSGGTWLVANVAIGQDYVAVAAFNPGFPNSLISRNLRDDLQHVGRVTGIDLIEGASPAGYLVKHLRVQDQALPDLACRFHRLLGALQVDLVFGYDFFSQFDEIVVRPGDRLLKLRTD